MYELGSPLQYSGGPRVMPSLAHRDTIKHFDEPPDVSEIAAFF